MSFFVLFLLPSILTFCIIQLKLGSNLFGDMRDLYRIIERYIVVSLITMTINILAFRLIANQGDSFVNGTFNPAFMSLKSVLFVLISSYIIGHLYFWFYTRIKVSLLLKVNNLNNKGEE